MSDELNELSIRINDCLYREKGLIKEFLVRLDDMGKNLTLFIEEVYERVELMKESQDITLLPKIVDSLSYIERIVDKFNDVDINYLGEGDMEMAEVSLEELISKRNEMVNDFA
jgi:hypothetical protein